MHVSGKITSHCDSAAVSLEIISVRLDLLHTRMLIIHVSGD